MLSTLLIAGLPSMRLVDIIDIVFVAILFYQLYKLIKGTAAINIFLGIIAIYFLWKIVRLLEMELLSEILGQFISVGVIALIVVFQPEIRRFLLLLGTPSFIRKKNRFMLFKLVFTKDNSLHVDPIIQACQRMSSDRTGALIVLTKKNELPTFINTGEVIDAGISKSLLETIFFKNSPLHDGAIIITDNRVRAARCILPVSANRNIPIDLGLRHRSAIGITEQSDAISIIVSEQTGNISWCKAGNIKINVTPVQLRNFLEEEFIYEKKAQN